MNKPHKQFCISEQKSSEFASLSGDYNPLHVDAVYSRRLQFGKPVIHGIHTMLCTWDAAFSMLPASAGMHLLKINAIFLNPIRINQTIEYHCEVSSDQTSADLSAFHDGKQILSLVLHFSETDNPILDSPVLDAQTPIEQPINQAFPPEHNKGSCSLYLDRSLAKKLFPNLSRHYPLQQLAQIITTTRIVGMKCPGLNSIFSRIDLNFQTEKTLADKGAVNYFEVHKDARVNILKMGVEGQNMEGTLGTFFRAAPVTQPSFSEISANTNGKLFSTQRALIIGGSRGVGETTAKILAAGGANVIISFNKGRSEAEQVKDEITQGNAKCEILKLNVTHNSGQSPTPFEDNQTPTHVYYFASPHIAGNRTKTWDKEIFEKFCQFYLEAFAETVKLYTEAAQKASAPPITFFFPSTIFIDQPENGFSEYAAAKGAGETLCQQLAAKYPNAHFITPRLPRMSTDQTSSIMHIKCDSVSDVMQIELENMVKS